MDAIDLVNLCAWVLVGLLMVLLHTNTCTQKHTHQCLHGCIHTATE